MSIKSVMPSNHLIFCHPLLLLPSILPRIRVFSNESVLHIRRPKYWCFSFSISPSNEYSGLIPFRIDWLDLLSVQGTLNSLLQHHSSKASILQQSAFFIVQLSHPYITTGKTIALTRQIFACKAVSLLFNMLPRFVIFFLPRSKRLLISWLPSPPAPPEVILEPMKITSCLHAYILCLLWISWFLCSVPSVMSDSLQPYRLQPTRLLWHKNLQARILEWVACPPPGDLPNPGIELASPASP